MITTLFKNTVDFYFSFGVGLSLAVAVIGFASVFSKYRRSKHNQLSKAEAYSIPPDRGDIPDWAVIAVYLCSCFLYIGISGMLIDWHKGVMIVLCLYAFVYTPIISYVTARLEGICGQALNIPLTREAGMILSGYQGLKIWFLPIPVANYGEETVFYRQAELTGTRFWSIWKADLILVPFILGCSIFFANFIWSMGPVPSSAYPYTEKVWELQAMNQALIYSSTTGQREFSQFNQALNPWYIGAGFALGTVGYAAMSVAGLPVLIAYGFIKGFSQSLPHALILMFIGGCLGRFYFKPMMGKRWLQTIPVVTAGFSCGMGLISMLCIGIQFLGSSVTSLPY